MALFNENGDAINEKRNVLDEIAQKTIVRINEKKSKLPLDKIKEIAENLSIDTSFPFEKALKCHDMAFICEVKKASPSKGLIAPDFPYVEIAKDYENAGASAISCLTEPFYFQGDDEYLREIVANVKIPVLRKDFTVDEYMIYEAKILGASAVLLICAILDDNQLESYFKIAESLGLSCVVEAHTEEEVLRAVKIGARIIGVNNRNLKNFHVDLNHSINLRTLVSNDVIFVSESGIKTQQDIQTLRLNNVNAVLIGETLMRADNKKEILDDLKG
ncbi:MAG: indole-3-glycerol phosphate synthase TrpC [Clostridia bacterium]